MTQKKNKVQAPVCPDYHITLNKGLADLAHSKTSERFHKFDALRYLLEKQAIHNLQHQDETPSAFPVTITQLSVDWNWHRHTVTSFLNDLMLLNFLSKEKTADGFQLFFPSLTIASQG